MTAIADARASFQAFLKQLNAAQREAVIAPSGPVVVLAGAGSGKTRVLTGRVFYLLVEKRAHPDSLVVMTFTNKAARELKERIATLLGEDVQLGWAGTFHSFAARLLRIYGAEIGLQPGYSIYDSADSESLCAELLANGNISRDELSPSVLRGWISTVKNDGKLLGRHPFMKQVYEFQQAYDEKLRAAQAVDFDDLLRLPLKLFSEKPNILATLQRRYQHILIDEFQDTNVHQHDFAKQLALPSNDLYVVGDDDQSIYSWRGAKHRHIIEFEHSFAGAHVYRLEENYRSTQAILDVANDVIAANKVRTEKNLWTAHKGGEKVTLRTVERSIDEANEVIGEIVHQSRQEGRAWKEFAILLRTNGLSRQFEEVLVAQAIPYTIVGGLRFYERKEVKDLLAYLRITSNPDDDVALRRILKTPPKGIGDVTITTLEQAAKSVGTSLGSALCEPTLLSTLPRTAIAKLSPLADLLLSWRQESRVLPLDAFCEKVLDQSGLIPHYDQPGDPEAEERLENLRQVIEAARERARFMPGVTLTDFLSEAALVADADSYQDIADRVTLMTIHAAKGLEFPVVFVAGLEEGILPHQRSMGDNNDIEEERRLFYVAITRARERLYLSYAQYRTIWGSRDFQEPSRFLRDIEPAKLRGWTIPPERRYASAAIDDYNEFEMDAPRAAPRSSRAVSTAATASYHPVQSYKIGDLVEHPEFGLGVVTAKSGDAENLKVRVHFEGMGSKLLAVKYAPLKRAD